MPPFSQVGTSKPGVARASNPRTGEADTEESGVQNHPGLHKVMRQSQTTPPPKKKPLKTEKGSGRKERMKEEQNEEGGEFHLPDLGSHLKSKQEP